MGISVLDNGYVKVIETWGSDERIIEAARMSTNKGFLGWDKHEEGCSITATALCDCDVKVDAGDAKLLASFPRTFELSLGGRDGR